MAARVVSLILVQAEKEGMSRNVLLDAAGLDAASLTPPDSRVPMWAEVALWQLMAKATSNAGFGVRAGASRRVRDFGLLGYAMYYSSTLGAALRRLARYSHILSEAIQFTFETTDKYHVAVAESHSAIGAGLPDAVDYRLAAIVGACRELTGAEVVPSRVDFAYDRPADIAEHRRFFRCPLRFGTPASKVVFLERDLTLQVPYADETLAGYLSEHAEHVLRTLTAGASIREQVRSTIWALLSEGRPTLPRIASALHMPARTLQRRLADESTSVQAEIEHVRKTMAIASLRSSVLTVEEFAFLLGYQETSTFYRSFKRWTGKTPHHYRMTAA